MAQELGGRLSMEMEFDCEPGSDTFVTTDKVRGVILAHLNKGDVEAAARLIASSAPEVGDILLTQDAAVASRMLRESLAEAFVKARDFDRAGRAAVLIGDPGRAAPFFERSYQFAQAAKLYEQAGQLDKAADLYERDLRFEQAARFYEQCGQIERAAAAWERANGWFDAGRLWAKARRLDRAVEMLQKTEQGSPSYARSMLLLGKILEHSGHTNNAAGHYIGVVRTCALDDVTVEVYERLAAIYEATGEPDAARKLLAAVARFDPSRARSSMPPEAPVAGGVRPLVLPAPTLGAEAGGAAGKLTAMNADVDLLRELPLFAELSLDELRALQSLGQRCKLAPGELLIEQNREGEHLFVMLSGKVRVVHFAESGAATVLGELGYGAALGDMALVDSGPTSARVEALAPSEAYVWPLAQLRPYLASHEGTALRILKVISRTLSVRLRETNRRAAQAG